ncbi:hypothetical protein M5X06_22090 [Paenibacillus alvei]|uniref:Uncharacterized protein n=1 Tax=Paenibacillus alvei TaxID=44250 RepID=A0ABT4H2M5_PAEAL|nr:hypothetical protein [Paenibacillus alvei]MCY9763231.1 hypothetical protein [Paenibacillus alvei]MCY9769480.1 hypothetical protein [Paenibacillus alvei]
MTRVVSILFAAFIAVILIYLYPTSKSYDQQDQIAFNIVQKATTEFVDAVRSNGYITPKMYEDFIRTIDVTQNMYDVQMQHDERNYNPIYHDPANVGSFQEKYEVYYESFFTEQIMKVLFPDNGKDISDPSRRYVLHTYDYFSVVVKNTNTTNATLMRDFLTNSVTSEPTRIYIPYGGMVLDENI